jgi:heparan-alpha-glucosaminide N-acetyltransferase
MTSSSITPAAPIPQRYMALDAARGFVMLVLCTEGLGLGALDPLKHPAANLFRHLPWDGFVPWELIMPSLLFMVGASLPFALSGRSFQEMTSQQHLWKVLSRVFRMMFIGFLLWSYYNRRYSYDPIETLNQLALSYLIAYLILQLPRSWQVGTAAIFLAANWGLLLLFPAPDGNPYHPFLNAGARIDQFLLGINRGSDMNWYTLNCLGSGITVLFGAWTSQLLLGPRSSRQKLTLLLASAGASMAICLVLLPFNPIIHKCWTLSFSAAHTAAALLLVAAAYWLFDLCDYKRAAFPFVVIGVNSIFIYLLNCTIKASWLSDTLGIFTLNFKFIPNDWRPAFQNITGFLAMWYACYWLYQRKIFFKV